MATGLGVVRPRSAIMPLIAAMRPRQWTKNLVILGAAFFGFHLTRHAVLDSLIAFAAFCCASSCFYLVNDVVDAASDRNHPVKRYRPIASGALNPQLALIAAGVLLLGATAAGFGVSLWLGATVLAFAALHASYNAWFKHIVILDIIAISAGFIVRAFGGAAATNIRLSAWFLLCTAMLALFLAIEKRKGELLFATVGDFSPRPVLSAYSLPLLLRMESVVAPSVLMTYALWSSGPQVGGASTQWMLVTLPFVIYGIFRYQYLSDPRALRTGEELPTERPEEVLLTDGPLLLSLALWAMAVFAIFIGKHGGWIA